MFKQILRSTTIIGKLTLLSRLLGYLRDMLIARLFGAGIATDAFFIAFKIPNLFRRFFAEGAFSNAFIPVLTEYKEKHDRKSLSEFLNAQLGALSAVLGLVVACTHRRACFASVAATLQNQSLESGSCW